MSDIKNVDGVKVDKIPCRCPECNEVIERCTPCFIKKTSTQVVKDYGPIMGQMLLTKLSEYLSKLGNSGGK